MSALVSEIISPTRLLRPFSWTPQRSDAVVVLASGGTKEEAAEAAHCDRTTIYEWLKHPDFAAEVDRLSLMMHISSRAERLRIAMRVARARTAGEVPQTDKDLLDWLKFAQSETDGAKIDLSKLAEYLAGESGGGPDGPVAQQLGPAIDVSATDSSSEQSQPQGEVGPDEPLNAS